MDPRGIWYYTRWSGPTELPMRPSTSIGATWRDPVASVASVPPFDGDSWLRIYSLQAIRQPRFDADMTARHAFELEPAFEAAVPGIGHSRPPQVPRARRRPRVIDVDTRTAPPEEVARPEVRALYPPPGRRLDIRWANLREHLRGQVARPELLGDRHLLPVVLQVFEVLAPTRLRQLERCFVGAGRLARLDLATARALRLKKPPSGLPEADADPDALRAGDYVFTLTLLQDPTADARPAAGTPGPEPATGRPPPPSDPAPASPATTAEPIHVSPQVPPEARIPARYRAPWVFQRNREDVLFDLDGRMGLTGVAARAWRFLRSRFGRRGRFYRWQTRLAGKSLDDQLWTVQPPAWGLDDPWVTDWAHHTLAAAGYDPGAMLDEWTIYWRRRGA